MLSTKQKIRLARTAARLVSGVRRGLGAGEVAEVRRDGLNWRLDLGEGIDFAIYLLGRFERGTQQQYGDLLKPGDVALDIGANIGAHTLPIARLVGTRGCVHAFEPTAFAFTKLQANIARNADLAQRIKAQQILLSDGGADSPPAAVAASWPLGVRPGGHPVHGGHDMTTAGAAAETLDTYVAREGIERIDFIKLDVDGNECQVLRGGQDTLRRFHPPIILELAPYVFSGGENSFETFTDLLRGAGYRLMRSPNGAELPQDAAALARSIADGASINAWAMRA
ncbi:MAG: FkbM family methyltransferase [Proteobacteria bacterium]|nr:FkbM family methyltransferase [Pseudomonadota bacterium]MDA1357761.1 FkbM family methyltransferase [Pseudomonadota bacterium]